jgi:hypothetical protein
VVIGPKWSAWHTRRRQWLLAAITGRNRVKITLKSDIRYSLAVGDDTVRVQESAVLTTSNLFRYIAP